MCSPGCLLSQAVLSRVYIPSELPFLRALVGPSQPGVNCSVNQGENSMIRISQSAIWVWLGADAGIIGVVKGASAGSIPKAVIRT
jgi:hypothetical protein